MSGQVHNVNPDTDRCVRCGKNRFNREAHPVCMTTGDYVEKWNLEAAERKPIVLTGEPRNPSSEAGLRDMAVRWLREQAENQRFTGDFRPEHADSLVKLLAEAIRAALAKEARDAPRRLPSLMLEWQRVAHSSGWPEEAKRLIDDMLSALLAFVDPHVEIDGKWVREAEARDAGAREEPISGVEFNLRYGHQATCVFGLENSGMCDCGKGFIGAARDAAKEAGRMNVNHAEIDFELNRRQEKILDLLKVVIDLRAELRKEANQLEAWANESRSGGWSTHQVDPMRRRADELRRIVAQQP